MGILLACGWVPPLHSTRTPTHNTRCLNNARRAPPLSHLPHQARPAARGFPDGLHLRKGHNLVLQGNARHGLVGGSRTTRTPQPPAPTPTPKGPRAHPTHLLRRHQQQRQARAHAAHRLDVAPLVGHQEVQGLACRRPSGAGRAKSGCHATGWSPGRFRGLPGSSSARSSAVGATARSSAAWAAACSAEECGGLCCTDRCAPGEWWKKVAAGGGRQGAAGARCCGLRGAALEPPGGRRGAHLCQ